MKKILSGRVATLSRAAHSPVLPLLRRGLGGGLAILRSPFSVFLIALAMVFAGCEKNDDSNDNNEPPVLPEGPWDITLTVVPFYDNNGERARTIAFRFAAQQLVIDWGDGSTVETYANVTEYVGSVMPGISHDYTGSGTYTVRIQEEGLTYFSNTYSLAYSHVALTTSLDVSGCQTLKSLDCYSNQLTSLDVSKCTALQRLGCYRNQLTSLNVSGCTALQELSCEGNQLTSLNVSGCTALQELWCHDNQLTSLNVNGCTALQRLICEYNQLTSLDASGCMALEVLRCYDNQLTSLNVSGCAALQELWCYNNQLTSLNVSGCAALQGLGCGGNQLTSLNVNGCTALQTLGCSENQLTSLNVSGCTALQILGCSNNQLTAPALNTVFTALHDSWGSIYIGNNPGTDTCDRAIAENKGWVVFPGYRG